MKQLTALFSILLILIPAVSANHYFDRDAYYSSDYGSDLGRGRTYESFSRSYDTSKSDIASHTVSRSGSGAQTGYPWYGADSSGGYGGISFGGNGPYGGYGYNNGYGNWYQYQPTIPYPTQSYPDGYFQGYIPPYNPSSSRSYSDTFTDNYNRQYNERTNENIKVDRYSRYDDVGLVHLVAGDYYGGRRPYFISYDSTSDPYVYRYPYAGSTSGDRGYFAQPYYSTARIETPTPRVSQPMTRYAERNNVVLPSGYDARLEQGPSQGYINTITDRGPLYAPLKPLASQLLTSPAIPLALHSLDSFSSKQLPNSLNPLSKQETGGSIRNTNDRSVYDGEPERDSSYVQPYGTGRKP